MLLVGDCLPASAAAQVRSDARAFVQDLDRGGCRADLDQFMHQVVGHAVEVGIERDVIVDVDAGARPLAQIEGFHRQRLQGGFVDGSPNCRARSILLTERPVIQLVQQFADGNIQFFEREELPIPQRRYDPTLGYLHGVFDFGFVECQQLQGVPMDPAADSASPTPFIRWLGLSTK
jgi:hypothetical protein